MNGSFFEHWPLLQGSEIEVPRPFLSPQKALLNALDSPLLSTFPGPIVGWVAPRVLPFFKRAAQALSEAGFELRWTTHPWALPALGEVVKVTAPGQKVSCGLGRFGREAFLPKTLLEGATVLLVDQIKPHALLGFSGGPATLLEAMGDCWQAAFEQGEVLARLKPGRLRGNPLAAEAVDWCAWQSARGKIFALNVMAFGSSQAWLSGHPLSTLKRALALAPQKGAEPLSALAVRSQAVSLEELAIDGLRWAALLPPGGRLGLWAPLLRLEAPSLDHWWQAAWAQGTASLEVGLWGAALPGAGSFATPESLALWLDEAQPKVACEGWLTDDLR